jgi:hypothetical protein
MRHIDVYNENMQDLRDSHPYWPRRYDRSIARLLEYRRKSGTLVARVSKCPYER